MGKRFNVIPMSNIKSHFVTIDSRVLYGIMKEFSPEFSVSREEFSGENRETYLKNIFNFKRLRVSKQKIFTGMIETDGVAMCVHYRRLKTDRPGPPSATPVTKNEENKEEHPETHELEDNDFLVDAAKEGNEKEAGLMTQEVGDNDLVVDAGSMKRRRRRILRCRRWRITTWSLTRRSMKITTRRLLRRRKCKISTLSLARTPETQISSPSQHQSVRKMVLTVVYVRKTCVY